MATVYIVSFYSNITKIETRSFHRRLTQSRPDKESHVAVRKMFQLGFANGYLSRVPNTIITDEIVMIKSVSSRGHFQRSLSLNDNDSTFQHI